MITSRELREYARMRLGAYCDDPDNPTELEGLLTMVGDGRFDHVYGEPDTDPVVYSRVANWVLVEDCMGAEAVRLASARDAVAYCERLARRRRGESHLY